MKNEVFCVRLKKNLIGLEEIPVQGKLGEKIKKHVSQQAWKEWLSHQTILINEKKLNLFKLKDRLYLKEALNNFFFF